MHHIVYKTTRQSTGEYYIGVHSTHNINDTYMGSGDRIKRLITKYGKSDFVRITLVECTTRADALKREADILTNEVLNDPLCLNITVGGKGNPAGGHGISDDARAKLRLIHLGKSKSEETRKRISESKKRAWDCNIITDNKRQMLNTKEIFRCGKIRTLERKRLRWKKRG